MTATEPAPVPASAGVVAGHVRGSTLLLAGRVAAMAVSFATQVIIVRQLTKADYGTFAFALAVVMLLESILPLGMDRSDTRFLALYDERRDHGRLLGVVVFEAVVIAVLGIAAIATAWLVGSAAGGALGGAAARDHYGVLLVMLALAPLQAIDTLVVNAFAVFARPWAVFLRRYVLEPGLRLLAGIALVLAGGGVLFLAIGYVIAGVVGGAVYIGLLVRLLVREGYLTRESFRAITIPARALLAFSVPLLLTNVVAVASTQLAVVFLGHFAAASDVAAFRAVEPLAALNLVVMYSFTTLFTPAAARLYARKDAEGLRELYWQTASWVAVLTFPVVCATSALASPIATTAFGARYAGSALYLALLAVAYYVNAALGMNGITAIMLGRVRYITLTNVGVVAWMVAANWIFISRWGTIGAVAAVVSTVVVHNVVKQLGAGLGTPVGVVHRRHAAILLVAAGALGAVNAMIGFLSPPLPLAVAVVAVATAVVVWAARSTLELGRMFPELAQIPFVRLIVR